MTQPLWTPSQERIDSAAVTGFAYTVAQRFQTELSEYQDLHRWSILNPREFWSVLWEYTGVIAADRGETVVENIDSMPGAELSRISLRAR